MNRRAFARYRTGALLLLGLSLRAPGASAEPAEPDDTRAGTREGEAAKELPGASVTPPIPASVATRRLGDGVADPEPALGERFYERVEVRSILALDASGHVRSSSVEVALEGTGQGPGSASGGSFPTREEGILATFGKLFSADEGFGPSLIHLGSMDRVEPHPGGYPARVFRPAGGVVSGQGRGPEPALSVETRSSRFGVGNLIVTPFARGRGGLLPALLSWLSPEVKLDSRDYQARTPHEPSARDRFSVFGFGASDLPGEKRNGILGRLGDACRPRITFTW